MRLISFKSRIRTFLCFISLSFFGFKRLSETKRSGRETLQGQEREVVASVTVEVLAAVAAEAVVASVTVGVAANVIAFVGVVKQARARRRLHEFVTAEMRGGRARVVALSP